MGGVAAGSVAAESKAADGSAVVAAQRTEECVGKGRTGGNRATVAGAGDACRPEHGRAGDAVAGGPGKRAAAGKTA